MKFLKDNIFITLLGLLAMIFLVGGGFLFWSEGHRGKELLLEADKQKIQAQHLRKEQEKTNKDVLGENAQQLAWLEVGIKITAPLSGANIYSPLEIEGEAKGSWYFEGIFAVRLLDAEGSELDLTHAIAQSHWMSEDFVPFKATMEFPAQPSGSYGYLVFNNDNPSGLPSNSKEIRLPIKFK